MIALDTNILVYAHRREATFHDQAFQLLQQLANGSARWAIPWPCVYEFFSVVTNPRIWKEQASTPVQAWAQIQAWSQSPSVVLLAETADFHALLGKVLQQPKIRGGIVHDARIAALCLAHGVEKLYSKDRDFSLFAELPTYDPLTG